MDTQASKPGFLPILVIIGVVIIVFYIAMLVVVPASGPGGLQAGNKLPEIKATGWLNGDTPTADALKGKVVVVEAFATWCGPCIQALPHVKSVQKKYRDKGVVFLTLTSEDESAVEDLKEIIDKVEIPWRIGYGAVDTMTALKVEYIPAMWIVGPDGMILWNGDPRDDIETELDKALALIKS